MNVVHTGAVYQIFGDGMKTSEKLPNKVFNVNFSKMQGFFLTAHHDLEVTEEKIYGTYKNKVDKILNGFAISNRNFGVILSGPKGVGKSLFAKILSIKAREKDMPVIIVSCYIPGIADFLSSIDQEVIVLFDEFEKNFSRSKEDRTSPQDEMLSLFDGLDCGKKLFVIICNTVDKLNNYLLNRPGRFHYHFMLDTPSPDEIREYLTDKLAPEYHGVIEKVVNFSAAGKITYDCLRAIAFELNQGYSLAETVEDLNITRDGADRFEVCIEFKDGSTIEAFTDNIDLCSNKPYGNWYRFCLAHRSHVVDYWFSFKPSDLRAARDGTLVLEPDKLIEKIVDKNGIEEFSPELQETLTKKADEVKRIVFAKPVAKRSKYVV